MSRRKVWMLRVSAFIIGPGGGLLAYYVLDNSSTVAGNVLSVGCLAIGLLLAYLSTRDRASG